MCVESLRIVHFKREGDGCGREVEGIERNPESPAVSARDMIMNILNFYNKDMYNQ